MGWQHPGMYLMWFIFIPIVVFFIWIMLRQKQTHKYFEQQKDSPLYILKKRYANGEITTEEYEQMKKKLLE